MDREEFRKQSVNVIGVLSIEAYQAEKIREGARKARQNSLHEHHCLIGDFENQPCWLSDFPVKDWCGNCKTVQPYHESYIKFARECGAASNKLTREIKKYLKEFGEV